MTSGGDRPLFAARLRAHRAARDCSLAQIAHRLRRLSREVEDGVEPGRDIEAIAAARGTRCVYPCTAWRARTQIQLHRAPCQAQDGHIIDGIGYATAAIEALPPERCRDGFIQTIAHGTATTIPTRARALRPVSESHELLALRPGT